MLHKEDYICLTPFYYTEVFDDRQHLCCDRWLYKNNNIKVTDNIKDNFHSNKADYIRSTILDGSYSLCNEDNCPKLSGLKKGIVSPGFYKKSPETIRKVKQMTKVTMVNFCFDSSCNLACPSCRVDFVNEIGERRLAVDEKMRQINDELSDDVESLYLSGTADPFFSNSYRKFLTNLDPNNYPNLNHIHLHTNGNLWTKQFWGKLHKIHHLIKSTEISIDAATKETYNIVRRGGDWDKLMDNLKFIVTLPDIVSFHFSMVVQKDNYKEMESFYKMIQQLFDEHNPTGNWKVFYNKLSDWGTMSKPIFIEKCVFEKNNALYFDFKKEIDKLKGLPNYYSNLGETK